MTENKKIIREMNRLLMNAIQAGYKSFFTIIKFPQGTLYTKKEQERTTKQFEASFKKWSKKEFGYEFSCIKQRGIKRVKNKVEALLADAYHEGYNSCASLRRPFNAKDKIIMKSFRERLKSSSSY